MKTVFLALFTHAVSIAETRALTALVTGSVETDTIHTGDCRPER